MSRWHTHAFVALGWNDGFTKPANTALLDGVTPTSNAELIDRQAIRLLGVPLTPGQQSALGTFLSEIGCPQPGETMRNGMDVLTWLVLDAPQWLQR